MLHTTLMIIHFFSAAGIISLVLLQRGKGAEAGAGFVGGPGRDAHPVSVRLESARDRFAQHPRATDDQDGSVRGFSSCGRAERRPDERGLRIKWRACETPGLSASGFHSRRQRRGPRGTGRRAA